MAQKPDIPKSRKTVERTKKPTAQARDISVEDRAQQIIERARRERWTRLDLSYSRLDGKLDEIPAEVFDLQQLEELSLDNQNIRTVPERVRELKKLKHLYVGRNPVESIPDIGGLGLNWEVYQRCRETLSKQNIECISIVIDPEKPQSVNARFGIHLTQELLSLPCLSSLQVGLSSISDSTTLPKAEGEILELVNSLGEFHTLEILGFFGLLLENVPVGIQDLQALRSLSIHGAGLRNIPDWIGRLTQLHFLELGMNELNDLPASLAKLTDLNGAKIRRLCGDCDVVL